MTARTGTGRYRKTRSHQIRGAASENARHGDTDQGRFGFGVPRRMRRLVLGLIFLFARANHRDHISANKFFDKLAMEDERHTTSAVTGGMISVEN